MYHQISFRLLHYRFCAILATRDFVPKMRCIPEPKACGRPEQPPNSTMIVTSTSSAEFGYNYEVGATVEYSCNPGSLLIGPSSRTCLETGFYNEFPPVCKSQYFE